VFVVAVCFALLYALVAVVTGTRYPVLVLSTEYWVALFFEALWVSVCCRCCDSCCCSCGVAVVVVLVVVVVVMVVVVVSGGASLYCAHAYVYTLLRCLCHV